MKKQIGRYQIIELLGKGGMGVVYRAYDPSLGREVAVKALLDELKNKISYRRRFQEEANMMASLRHPAIVPVYDVGEEDNQPYFVMDYMSGGPLSHRLRNGPIPLQEAVRMLHDLAAALDKVHDHGLIHRDIKPANILFDEDDRLYLADFGIARRIVPGKVTRAGTDPYMAPEQRAGHNLDRRSDVYQLGVVLLQMLTGMRARDLPIPYDIPSVYDEHSHSNLPPGCDEIIARALAAKKEDRYPTAGHLAAEFSALLEESETTPRREGESVTKTAHNGQTSSSRLLRIGATITIGILLGIVILVGVMKIGPEVISTPESPIGLLISFTPQVDIKHGDRLKQAEVGLKLYQDDVVIAQANAGAVVSLACPNETLLLTVGALQNMPVDCRRTSDENLVAQLNPEVISDGARSVVILPEQAVRSSREVDIQTPTLLTPRNTLIMERQPSFRWQAVSGASGYRLSLNIPNAENWQIETTETTLPYPADKAPLPAGGTIIVKLVTLDNPTEVEETFFDVMEEENIADVAQREAEIRHLDVDDTAQAYLLAQLYRTQGLNAAAIAQLEEIAAQGDAISADLWQQLGDLYVEVNLYAQAEEKYQQALSSASTNNDQQVEALANFGLAQTAYIFEEDQKALDYLGQAETLANQIGDDQLIEQITLLKQKIEALPN